MFAIIFILCLLTNLSRVGFSKPIELLYSESSAEREPRTKWILTALGLLTLGGGYFIALTVTSPLQALGLFFVAVILVIICTYCLFTAGSIAVLKLMRKNKKYYYKPGHFTSVSGMLHRMKRNAAGLASICILSTMVLVTVSTTLCLYIGEEDMANKRYPHDLSVIFRDPDSKIIDDAKEMINDEAEHLGYKITSVSEMSALDFQIEKISDEDTASTTITRRHS